MLYRAQDRNTEDVEYSSCYPSYHLRNSGINFLCLGKHLKTLNIYYNGLVPKLLKSVVLTFEFLPYYSEISDRIQ